MIIYKLSQETRLKNRRPELKLKLRKDGTSRKFTKNVSGSEGLVCGQQAVRSGNIITESDHCPSHGQIRLAAVFNPRILRGKQKGKTGFYVKTYSTLEWVFDLPIKMLAETVSHISVAEVKS